MKPAEILSMIEEAAGTRMFEMKKQAAQRTIAKKQTKVEEINKVSKKLNQDFILEDDISSIRYYPKKLLPPLINYETKGLTICVGRQIILKLR